ncbi:carnitine dehydratase [Anaerosporomusa subterranea]|uniref:Carnitine dehydratase n=1 Tax=Anaerosporomusa subterranea TaxID=1794912 RepID=A0A154BR74_ANASB|nr:CoA transferase [Anaerosporomusa subterranea]KYZ76330.1 carnitine dehydratase [Anaerosporomusa subterranea]
MNSAGIKPGALSGIRILDLTRVLAGPFCTMLLGDMGAEIIKIEEPGKGDDTRGYPPFIDGFSTYFGNMNRNKQSVTLDLKHHQGKQLFKEMVKKADVVIENYKPGTMAKLGIGYEDLKEINPQLVFASISGFGQYGPYTERPGYDIIGQAMGGLMSVSGWPDSPPTRSGTAMGDILGGLNCCIGILAALKGRDVTGRGQSVDVSLVDSVVSAMETILQIYLVEGRVPGRIGNRYEFIAPYDSFPATDGWAVIAVGNNAVWKRFCQVIGREDLIEHPDYKNNIDRVKNHQGLTELVSAWTITRTVDDVVETLLAKSVPSAPINDVSRIVNDPHIAGAREMFVEISTPVGKNMKVVACPIKFSETKASVRQGAPALGEHNDDVLSSVLGMDETAIARLKQSGALG